MNHSARILVVEDDRSLAELLVEELETEGWTVDAQPSAEKALEIIDEFEPDLVVSDLQLPDMDGLALLERLRQRHAPPAVLMISAYGTVERAVAALQAGAENFLTKPLDMDHFVLSVQRLVNNRRLYEEVRRFRELLDGPSFHGMQGSSRVMRVLFDRVRQVARADGPVLITGESGTGKDLVARAIHAESPRVDKPFLAVNCAGIPADLMESEFFGHAEGAFTGADRARKGLFREAQGGTLFLDEIGEMPLSLQAKMLRALQDGQVRPVGAEREHQVDVRLVAATNQDLHERVQDGRFREDLYYRLEAFQLEVPPLRDRGEDLEMLAMQFVGRFAAARQRPARSISNEALMLIRDYAWPGNVRELSNAMERAVTFCEGREIEAEHLPERVRRAEGTGGAEQGGPLAALLDQGEMLPTLDELRRRYVQHVLEKVDGNKRRAAALLGVGRRTLYRWLDEG
ncbi:MULTISPECIES: sigma-54 dependent transcriptional regulator [unclassified Wenzhouxiangella]|uniref:sigma-54-dependent transcriptional regulator n=1 Tax=unclassified Wenzhouxiangella TaxID=2613841 RepID=UPI000E32A9B2|nr:MULTISPECIES: sigma-54 dependent transcriptional regulator [unclassified Wenzhouxiangella]RFF27988.1 sigma-54-dependent Fis family transcriptional regulator [Wenzhouxiangella sp. 15181]RFP68575.1 sigma-54-dependent Fis family transcriptional regulator [Wenzhouxiangella sp. 15190]